MTYTGTDSNGVLQFTSTNLPGNVNTYSATFGDLDGDGKMELIRGGYDTYPIMIVKNDGSDNFPTENYSILTLDKPITGFTFGIRTADVDQDGNPDILVPTTHMSVFKQDDDGSFSVTQLPEPISTYFYFAVGDFNGDTYPDITIVKGNNGKVFVNDGNGNYSLASNLPDCNNFRIVTEGDFDNDGDIDLVTASYNYPARLYVNDGAGSFTSSIALNGPA